MAKKEYAFYPGCSSQLKASASNYLVSTNAMCSALDIKLTEIPDWNCCGASVGYCEGGELPRIAINARNFAQAETHLPGQDIVATCAACWLNARESKEKLDGSAQLLAETNEALKEAGLKYQAKAEAKLGELLDYHNFVLKNYFHAPIVDFQQTMDDTLSLAERRAPNGVAAPVRAAIIM